MKYYIIAGEASGDLHGANLIKELKLLDASAEFRCWGGDKMQTAGGHLVRHINDLAFMGFVEVLKHLGTILHNLSFCKKDIKAYQPDVVILIDYPGFNFRLFSFLKQNNFKIFYYISPQLWAWKSARVKKVKAFVDRMFVIFPFEKEFYARHGVEVDFVGHPLLDELQKLDVRSQKSEVRVQISDVRQLTTDNSQQTSYNPQLIAILPGSRKQEIKAMLPEFVKVIPHFPEYKFVIAGMSAHGREFYEAIIGDAVCEIKIDTTYAILETAKAALVTSGTATLETSLYNVPEVVGYKAGFISYHIAKRLIKGIEYICIVNLIADKKVVTELIQHDLNEENLVKELNLILSEEGRKEVLEGYDFVRTRLGNVGASKRTAELMLKYLLV